jgi:hypothetical protein
VAPTERVVARVRPLEHRCLVAPQPGIAPGPARGQRAVIGLPREPARGVRAPLLPASPGCLQSRLVADDRPVRGQRPVALARVGPLAEALRPAIGHGRIASPQGHATVTRCSLLCHPSSAR